MVTPILQRSITPTMSGNYSLKLDWYSSHRQIAAWLTAHKPAIAPQRPCVIYDIGCAQGFLGQLLPSADFTLYGLDYEPAAVSAAQAYYREVKQADIENDALPPFALPPDILVLADVLEHTRHPEACLQRLIHTYLRPGARVIISLPNIAHLYVRLSLLCGLFEYTDRGLLDRTHLRFFTRTSAIHLLQAAGLHIHQITVTPAPLPLIHPAFGENQWLWIVHQCNAVLARWFPTLFGYQIILYGQYDSPA